MNTVTIEALELGEELVLDTSNSSYRFRTGPDGHGDLSGGTFEQPVRARLLGAICMPEGTFIGGILAIGSLAVFLLLDSAAGDAPASLRTSKLRRLNRIRPIHSTCSAA